MVMKKGDGRHCVQCLEDAFAKISLATTVEAEVEKDRSSAKEIPKRVVKRSPLKPRNCVSLFRKFPGVKTRNQKAKHSEKVAAFLK